MADKTGITWTNATWNPVRGCERVSEGCRNCYAEVLAARHSYAGGWGEKIARWVTRADGTKEARWTGVIQTIDTALGAPLKWKSPRRVFVNSMSDLFHKDVPDAFILRVWQIMGRCQQHTFQILTKRPERMLAWLTQWADLEGENFEDFKNARGPDAVRALHPSGRAKLFAAMLDSMGDPPPGCAYPTFDWFEGLQRWPTVLPNVQLGVSAEDQATFDQRVEILVQVPAAVRFVSAEPLLGAIDVGNAFDGPPDDKLHWVIVGGESGQDYRRMNMEAARWLIDQCKLSGVPIFVKQDNGPRPGMQGRFTDAEWALKEFPGMSGWIAVDLDGTLALYDGFKGCEHIGDPIPAMLARVKDWLAEGREVRIFTARVGATGLVNKDGTRDDGPFAAEARRHIEEWCLRHVGVVLPVTATKDFGMVELWDDRAVQVEPNTGRRMDGQP